jgi:hypothetical protein
MSIPNYIEDKVQGDVIQIIVVGLLVDKCISNELEVVPGVVSGRAYVLYRKRICPLVTL